MVKTQCGVRPHALVGGLAGGLPEVYMQPLTDKVAISQAMAEPLTY